MAIYQLVFINPDKGKFLKFTVLSPLLLFLILINYLALIIRMKTPETMLHPTSNGVHRNTMYHMVQQTKDVQKLFKIVTIFLNLSINIPLMVF